MKKILKALYESFLAFGDALDPMGISKELKKAVEEDNNFWGGICND